MGTLFGDGFTRTDVVTAYFELDTLNTTRWKEGTRATLLEADTFIRDFDAVQSKSWTCRFRRPSPANTRVSAFRSLILLTEAARGAAVCRSCNIWTLAGSLRVSVPVVSALTFFSPFYWECNCERRKCGRGLAHRCEEGAGRLPQHLLLRQVAGRPCASRHPLFLLSYAHP